MALVSKEEVGREVGQIGGNFSLLECDKCAVLIVGCGLAKFSELPGTSNSSRSNRAALQQPLLLRGKQIEAGDRIGKLDALHIACADETVDSLMPRFYRGAHPHPHPMQPDALQAVCTRCGNQSQQSGITLRLAGTLWGGRTALAQGTGDYVRSSGNRASQHPNCPTKFSDVPGASHASRTNRPTLRPSPDPRPAAADDGVIR